MHVCTKIYMYVCTSVFLYFIFLYSVVQYICLSVCLARSIYEVCVKNQVKI
jgi:hypothetical protein